MTAQVQPATTPQAPRSNHMRGAVRWTEQTGFVYDGRTWCLVRGNTADVGLDTIEEATAYAYGVMRQELRNVPGGDEIVMRFSRDRKWIHQMAHEQERKVNGGKVQ